MPRTYKLESNAMSSSRKNKPFINEHEVERGFILNHTTVSNLILEISNLLRKSTIDEQHSNILDKFLNYLKESERYLENGIFTINFAEASLLLQNSCVLYGKKVDILWNDVIENLQRLRSYGKLRNVFEAFSEEKELHDKINRFRRRKTVLQQENSKNPVFNHNSLLQEAGNIPNLPEIVGSACKTLESLWSEATQSSLKLKRLRAKVAPLVYTHIKKTPIYSEGSAKKLCNYHDLCLNLYESGYMLYDDRTTQLYNLRYLIDDILQSYLAQHEITYIKLTECNMWSDFKKYLQVSVAKRLRVLLKIQRERMNGGWDRKRPLIAQKPPVDLSMLHIFGEFQISADKTVDEEITEVVETDGDSDVTISPVSLAKSYVSRRTSEMHSETDSAFHDGSFEDDEERHVQNKQEGSYVQRSTATESRKITVSSDDTGYFEDTVRVETSRNDTDSVNQSDLTENEVSREGWINNNEEVEVFRGFGIYDVSEDEHENEEWGNGDHNFQDKNKKSKVTEKIILDEHSDCEHAVLQRKIERKRRRDDTVIDSGILPKKREIMRIKSMKEGKILTVPLRIQENFFVRCYSPEENEGGIPPCEYESTDYEECDVDVSNCSSKEREEARTILASVLIDHCYYKSLSSEELLTQAEIPFSFVNDLHPISTSDQIEHNENAARTTTPILQTTSEQVKVHNQTNENGDVFYNISKNNNEMEWFSKRKAVLLDWKSFIQPKIDAASQKPDFDIHEYGTLIMDVIPLGESRKFDCVIKDKPTCEVSRLFLATLQLANTNNVQLENIPEGQLANGTMSIKLLSRERYHEQLEEYIAPSEKTYNNRLKQACQSTDSSIPNKKIKIYKGKLLL